MNRFATRVHVFHAVLAILLVSITVQATAQMGTSPGPHRGTQRPMYNAGSEITVTGTVSEVQQLPGQAMSGQQPFKCPKGWTGTHLTLKTDTGTLIVHVGPSAYLASKNFTIEKGSQLTVLGSKVQYQGSDFLIAREISKDNETLQLRDSRGFPSGEDFGEGLQCRIPRETN